MFPRSHMRLSVTGYFISLVMVTLPAWGRDLTTQEVLEKVVSTYGSLKSVHIVAEKEEITNAAGRAQTALSEYELATATDGRYLARLKQPPQEILTVSDGMTIWLALNSRKQWSRVSAASQDDDNDEEHDARAASTDLHDTLENNMLHRYLALTGTVQHPVALKRQEFELGRETVPCYAIRAQSGGSEIELLIDRQRFVVLQYTEKSGPADARTAITMKIRLMELNQEVSDSLFRFEPNPGWSEVGTLAAAAAPIRIGDRAADFTVRTLDGETVALKSLRGSVVTLDFWATWCVPCRMEFPAIEKIRSEFSGAVRFYGISDESLATVKKFTEENHYQMPMLLDSNREIRRRYGIHKIPVLLVIDRDGVVRQQFIGAHTEPELREAIRSVVDREAPNQ
jgi:cytochrome c biogenesis protein CcmG/thiol:disulfide interchange protein DsbE